MRAREPEPWRIPVFAQRGQGGPRPSRSLVQVPRSRKAVPAAPRSTPLARAASEALCDRISLSLFPAGGAAAAAERARQRTPWPRAPSPPGRSPNRCSSLGCRRRRPGGSGRKPARRRRRRPHRPPHCCPSPPTCPRARRRPSEARRRGRAERPAPLPPWAGQRHARASSAPAPRRRRLAGSSGGGAAATGRSAGGGGRGGGRAGAAALGTQPRTLWVQPRRRIRRPAGSGPGAWELRAAKGVWARRHARATGVGLGPGPLRG